MNDEIKEILDRIETASEIFDCLLKPEECTKLLDYITNLEDTLIDKQECIDAYNEIINNRDKEITNLQQEIDRLNKEINNKEFIFVGTAQNKTRDFIKNLIKEKNDYKSRCEKVSEYIDKQKKKMYKSRNKIALFILMKLENILENESDSQ